MCIAFVLALGVGLAIFTRSGPEPVQDTALPSPASHAGHPAAVTPGDSNGPAAARTFAAALFSYDTRSQSLDQWANRLRDAVGAHERPAALAELEARLPSGHLWRQMSEAEQHAEFTATSVAVPRLWMQTLEEHPELPAGALALTVAGEQRVTWSGGSSRTVVAVTLLLLCPPSAERCAVARVPPQVAR